MNEKIMVTYVNKKGQRRNTPLYRVWADAKQRCLNPKRHNYNSYGRRGISICNEWVNDFQVFGRWALANGYRQGLQIDRIDNDGNYHPWNCRFVTGRENQSNKQNSNEIVGVQWDKSCKKWRAKIEFQGKSCHLGRHADIEIAAFAYEFALAGILGLED